MKKSTVIIISTYLLINAGFYINYFINKKPETQPIKCKVIDKKESDKLSYYKGHSKSIGTSRTFIVNSRFGYGEIPVTVNTFYTTKINETIVFDLNNREVLQFFNKDFIEPWYLQLFGIVFIITLMLLLITITTILLTYVD